jgi:replication factor C large subunit
MTELWVEKYKPKTLKEIVAQKRAIEQAVNFVRNFKKGKALFLYGPTGIGKTVIVEALANEMGYNLIRLNASDKRTADEIGKTITTTKMKDLFHRGKIILVDEMEGLSGGDRGAVGAIVKLIKESEFPVFLVGSDPYLTKLRSLRTYCTLVKMSKVPTPSIEKRLREIAQKEGIEVKEDVLKILARFSQGDMRSAIMDLQMASKNKKIIGKEDMEAIGYRDRGSSIFETLPSLFNSGNIKAARIALENSDKDPDELFYWIENNIQYEFSGEELGKAYEIVSKADIFKNLVLKQRNYRFRRYMLDVLASLSTVKRQKRFGFVSYKPPQYFMDLARTRIKRSFVNNLCKKIGDLTHSSVRLVKEYYLPYLKIILKQSKDKEIEGLELTKEEMEFLRG